MVGIKTLPERSLGHPPTTFHPPTLGAHSTLTTNQANLPRTIINQTSIVDAIHPTPSGVGPSRAGLIRSKRYLYME